MYDISATFTEIIVNGNRILENRKIEKCNDKIHCRIIYFITWMKLHGCKCNCEDYFIIGFQGMDEHIGFLQKYVRRYFL